MKQKAIYFRTLGCKVNQYETQEMRERLLNVGFIESAHPECADYLLLNSCTVTHESDRKTRYIIRQFKRRNATAKVIITGCYTANDPERVLQETEADVLITNEEKKNIVSKLINTGEQQCGNAQLPDDEAGLIHSFENHTRPFIKIQDGCTMNCSYCKVRIVRNRPISRPAKSVMTQARYFADAGYKEIVLTGIQLGAYGRDIAHEVDLAELVARISTLEGIERIRLSSIEPLDITSALINLFNQNNKLCPHFHIPLQSGDNGILKKMRRSYTRESFSALIERLRGAVSDFAFTTDIIVGFPGENERAFEQSVMLLNELRPFKMHIFPFSPREGTDAFLFQERVAADIVKQRVAFLKKVNERFFREMAESYCGRDVEVLVESKHKTTNGMLVARMRNYVRVCISGSSEQINRICSARIKAYDKNYLYGDIL